MKSYYKATRFTTEEDTWPPEQPRHFTPVVLVRQQGQRSKKEAEVQVTAIRQGGIDNYISTTTNKITKDLQEVFSQLEDPSESSQHQRSILVEGSPGVGKSVLLKHIAYLWANGKLLNSTRFLFLLHLRDPTVQQINSLHTLVHHFYHYERLALKMTSRVAQDDGNSVTILLDGYDELPPPLRQNGFIVDLLQHKILPSCSIVISSRPHVSTHLRHNISCQVEILGFSQQDQQHFIEHSLKGQPHKISKLKQYLKHHPNINNLCFIPFYLTILLFLYKDKEERPLPNNSTDLYNLFICLTICRHLAKSGITLDEEITHLNSLQQPYNTIINQLSKFAFKTLGNNQVTFTLAEIKKECPDIDKAINGFGLLQVVEYVRRTSTSLSLNFIHLSIQEFLAAYYVTTLSPSQELSILQKNFWNNAAYFNMFDIYVALTNGQRPSFKEFLQPSSLMDKFQKIITGKEEDSVGISQELLGNKIKCLRIYHSFQQAGDKVMCKYIEDAASLHKPEINLNFYNTRLSPSDLECLTIFLACSSRKEWNWINLNGCHIQDHGLKILHHGLRNSDVTITHLWLSSNDLTAVSSSAISDLTISCRVKKLYVGDNSVNTIGEDNRLYKIITNPSSMLEVLDMSHSNLSSSAAIKLFTVLSEANKLKALWINGNSITDEAHDAIIMAMKKNNSLVELYMYKNPISGECAQFIVQALQYNNTLRELWLNEDYFDDVKKKIGILQEEVNKRRRTHGCQVKLAIIC